MQSFTIEEIKKIHQVWKKSNFAPPVPPARGSLTHSQALSLSLSKRARDVTALRCSEPLRSKVGGPKRSAPGYARWDRLGKLYFFTLIIIGFLKLWN